MSELPTIQTKRLLLRPFTLDHAPDTQRLAGDREVAATTLTIPHPYPDGAAQTWIATHAGRYQRGEALPLAITRRMEGDLVGAIGLDISRVHAHAELGYWIAREHWGNGFATEAAAAVVAYGFGELGLERIHAHYMHGNPASGRVLAKIGMREEGRLRRHICKWGVFVDMVWCGMLKDEEPTGA